MSSNYSNFHLFISKRFPISFFPETTPTTQTNFISNAKPFLNKKYHNQFRSSFKISFKTNFIKELEIGIQFKNHPNHFRTSFKISFKTSLKTSFRKKTTLTNSKPVLLKPALPSTVLLQLVFIKRSFTFYLLFCNIPSTVTLAISFFLKTTLTIATTQTNFITNL